MIETKMSMIVTCDQCGHKEIFSDTSFERVVEDFSHTKWIVDTPTGRREDSGHFCSPICRDAFFSNRSRRSSIFNKDLNK